jgi:hypothetical protein
MSGDLADLYRDLILDHSRRRRGEGPLEAADAEHHELNPTCGDEITVRIRLDYALGRKRMQHLDSIGIRARRARRRDVDRRGDAAHRRLPIDDAIAWCRRA